MKKLRELFRLKFQAKLTHRQIGKALNVSPGTVSYYAQAANALGLNWQSISTMSDKNLIEQIEPVAKQLRKSGKRTIPNWACIHQSLAKKHVTLMLLWEDYAKLHENAYSYTQFTRLYKVWCKQQRLSMRIEHKAGDKAFIDYAGTTIPVYCRQTGKIDFQAQLFVVALCVSQYTFAYACRSQKLPDWIDAHNRAFRFFGGVPSVLVPDNLKSGVTNSCQFEPEANPTYADMAEHYKTAIIPARPRAPQDKSIAENAVLVSSRWIITRLAKNKFYSLQALNNAIAELLVALNKKPFQKRQGSRYQQFMDIERHCLQALPEAEYEFATLKYQTVSPDYHVRIEGHYYSVPHALVGEKVLCRYNHSLIEIFHDNERKASHIRSFVKDKKTTVTAHMPKAHRDYHQWTPQQFLNWAEHTGSGVMAVAEIIVQSKRHPEQCSRIHFGLKRLCKQFGKTRLNQACRRAIALECVQFKSIQSILTRGLDKTPCMKIVTVPELPDHQNVRGANYYQEK